uniref:RGS domain-containing protein n=1 Tax=Hucho hucho TaxID=62062 RepID=A0A4W5KMM7_9TELE
MFVTVCLSCQALYQLAPDEKRRDCGIKMLETYFNNGSAAHLRDIPQELVGECREKLEQTPCKELFNDCCKYVCLFIGRNTCLSRYELAFIGQLTCQSGYHLAFIGQLTCQSKSYIQLKSEVYIHLG